MIGGKGVMCNASIAWDDRPIDGASEIIVYRILNILGSFVFERVSGSTTVQ